jgi:hypothetical protein
MQICVVQQGDQHRSQTMADLPDQQAFQENVTIARQQGDVDRSPDSQESKDEPVPIDEDRGTPGKEENGRLLPSEQCMRLDKEWQAIQAGFVDAPRASVEMADALVTKTFDAIAASYAELRNSLEKRSKKDREVSTEDLRMALQDYRACFRRLLSI